MSWLERRLGGPIPLWTEVRIVAASPVPKCREHPEWFMEHPFSVGDIGWIDGPLDSDGDYRVRVGSESRFVHHNALEEV